jgi:DNA-binding NarL/FixJ family response regulator
MTTENKKKKQENKPKPKPPVFSKFTEDEKAKVLNLYNQGKNYNQVGAMLYLNAVTVKEYIEFLDENL